MKKIITLGLSFLFALSSIFISAQAVNTAQEKLSSKFLPGVKFYSFRNTDEYPYSMGQSVSSILHYKALSPSLEFKWKLNGEKANLPQQTTKIGTGYLKLGGGVFGEPKDVKFSMKIHDQGTGYTTPATRRKYILDPEEGRSIDTSFQYELGELSPEEQQEIRFFATGEVARSAIYIWKFFQGQEEAIFSAGRETTQKFSTANGTKVHAVLMVLDGFSSLISQRVQTVNLETGALEDVDLSSRDSVATQILNLGDEEEVPMHIIEVDSEE